MELVTVLLILLHNIHNEVKYMPDDSQSAQAFRMEMLEATHVCEEAFLGVLTKDQNNTVVRYPQSVN